VADNSDDLANGFGVSVRVKDTSGQWWCLKEALFSKELPPMSGFAWPCVESRFKNTPLLRTSLRMENDTELVPRIRACRENQVKQRGLDNDIAIEVPMSNLEVQTPPIIDRTDCQDLQDRNGPTAAGRRMCRGEGRREGRRIARIVEARR
jgi:hypothetical protein